MLAMLAEVRGSVCQLMLAMLAEVRGSVCQCHLLAEVCGSVCACGYVGVCVRVRSRSLLPQINRAIFDVFLLRYVGVCVRSKVTFASNKINRAIFNFLIFESALCRALLARIPDIVVMTFLYASSLSRRTKDPRKSSRDVILLSEISST